jgi:hypothetical protein
MEAVPVHEILQLDTESRNPEIPKIMGSFLFSDKSDITGK